SPSSYPALIRVDRGYLPKRLECGTDLVGEQLRLLPGGEMAAPFSFVEIDQAGKGLTGPRFRSSEELVLRKRSDSHRDRNLVGLLRSCTNEVYIAVFPVEPRRRGRRVGQPVQRQVVQYLISGRRLLWVLAVRPSAEPGHEQERREAGGGVHQAVADGLRPRAHHRHVGQAPVLDKPPQRLEFRAFLLGESR